MIDVASCKQVSKNELTPGGTIAAISAINSSAIGPGPLGIADTKPIAFAPAPIAIHASSTLAMQQILIRGLSIGLIENSPLNYRQLDHREGAGVVLDGYCRGAV